MKNKSFQLILFISIFIIGNELKAQIDTSKNKALSNKEISIQDTLNKEPLLKRVPTVDIRESNKNYQNKTDSVILISVSNPNLTVIKKEGSDIVLSFPKSAKPKPKLIVSNGHWSWEVVENPEITNQNLEKSVTKFKLEHPDIYEKLNCDEAIIVEIEYNEFINLMPENKEYILAHPELYKLLPER